MLSVIACSEASKQAPDNFESRASVIIMPSLEKQKVVVSGPIVGKAQVSVAIPSGANVGTTAVEVNHLETTRVGDGLPVWGQLIQIGPPGLVLAKSIQIRISLPPPAAMRRYRAAVTTDPSNAVGFTPKTPGRRIALGTPLNPDAELWEFDVDGPGYWALITDVEPLGNTLASGGTVVDETVITPGEEEQIVVMGPPGLRVAVVIPAEFATASEGAVAGAGLDWIRNQDFRYDRMDLDRAFSPRIPTPNYQVGPRPRTVQVIAPLPSRQPVSIPPSQPGGVTKKGMVVAPVVHIGPTKVPTAVTPMPPTGTIGPRPKVIVPVPEATSIMKKPVAVSSGESDPDWTPDPVPPTKTRGTAVGLPDVIAYEAPIDWDSDGYYGIGLVEDVPTPRMAELQVMQTEVSLGVVAVGSSGASTSITVSNLGDVPTGVITVATGGNTPGDFALNNGCNGALSARATCTVGVVFSPADVGSRTATLNISAAPGGTVTLNLTGMGLLIVPPSAKLVITPVRFDFGTVGLFESGSLPFTLTNVGDAASEVPMFEFLSGPYQLQRFECNSALAPGASCQGRIHRALLSPLAPKPGPVNLPWSVTAGPGVTANSEIVANFVCKSRSIGNLVGNQSFDTDISGWVSEATQGSTIGWDSAEDSVNCPGSGRMVFEIGASVPLRGVQTIRSDCFALPASGTSLLVGASARTEAAADTSSLLSELAWFTDAACNQARGSVNGGGGVNSTMWGNKFFAPLTVPEGVISGRLSFHVFKAVDAAVPIRVFLDNAVVTTYEP